MVMKRMIFIPIFILAGLAAAFFLFLNKDTVKPSQYISGATPGLVAAQAYVLPAANNGFSPSRINSVADPVVNANEALVYDLDTGDSLFKKNADVRAPVASLTKILTALVVQDQFSMQDIITVASGSVKVGSDGSLTS